MEEVTVVDVRPQLVAGIRKRGYYREIAELLPRLYEYAMKKSAKFTNPPVFGCHETAEEAMEANKKGNALRSCITNCKEDRRDRRDKMLYPSWRENGKDNP